MKIFHTLLSISISAALLTISCGGGSGSGDNAPDEPKEIQSEEVIPMYEKSTVFILSEVGMGQSSGTGIVLDKGGNILTNNHVVDGAAVIEVRVPGTDELVDASIVGRSPCDDLAVIRVNRKAGEFEPAILGDSDKLIQGSKVFAVGYPYDPSNQDFTDTSLAVTEGLVSRLSETFEYFGLRDLIQTSAALNHGNSGGPLINKYGEVVGINTLGFAQYNVENINYAIAINEAKVVYETLLEEIDIEYVGVNLIPNQPQFEQSYGIPYIERSSVITSVTPNYQFDENNWVIYDVIARAAGSPVANMGDLCQVLRSQRSGDVVDIEGVGQYSDGAGGIYYDYYHSPLTIP
jgi:serine protease Do